jgi:hypothetical protein
LRIQRAGPRRPDRLRRGQPTCLIAQSQGNATRALIGAQVDD